MTTNSDPRVLALSTAVAALLVAVIDIARGGAPAAVQAQDVQGTTAPQTEKPATTRASRKPASAAPAADAAPATSSTAPEKPSATTGVATQASGDLLTAAKAITMRVSKEKGRETAVELLGKFDAVSASTMKPELHAEFIEAAEKVLSGFTVEEAVGGSDDDLA